MDLVNWLESLGDRLGILEKTSDPDSARLLKIQTRSVTLVELTAEIRSPDVQALAELPAELSVPFAKIFEAAGIAPPASGWTIERLGEILQREEFRNLERLEAQRRLFRLLSSENVEIKDLIKDAIARDQALDAFERGAHRKMEERQRACELKIAELEGWIAECQKECARLREQAKIEAETWGAWKREKQTQERALARTVSYLVDKPVITTDEDR